MTKLHEITKGTAGQAGYPSTKMREAIEQSEFMTATNRSS